MQRPHDINCKCEHCKYTRWVVRETMIERDAIIATLTRKLDPAITVRDAYMTQDIQKIMKAIENMRHVWNEIFIENKAL